MKFKLRRGGSGAAWRNYRHVTRFDALSAVNRYPRRPKMI
jgi:hypothetical protein